MEKMSALQQKIENSFVEFCEEHGHEPRYANCEIEWQDDHDTCDVVIKLSCDVDESEDDKIFFYCNAVRDQKLHLPLRRILLSLRQDGRIQVRHLSRSPRKYCR